MGFKLLSTPPSIGINIHIIGLNTFIIDINIGEKHDRNQLFGNFLRLTDMPSTSDFRKRSWAFFPTRPASYNNRAQCLRLAGRPDAALRDLDQAIRLSDGGKGRAGSAALCQRGVLHRKVSTAK